MGGELLKGGLGALRAMKEKKFRSLNWGFHVSTKGGRNLVGRSEDGGRRGELKNKCWHT